MPKTSMLLGSAALLPWLAIGPALAQISGPQPTPEQLRQLREQNEPATEAQDTRRRQPQPNFMTRSWSLEGALTYTDNFAQIGDNFYERFFLNDDGTFLTRPVLVNLGNGQFEIEEIPRTDSVQLETDEKIFATASISGFSAFDRGRSRGLIRGNVSFSTFLDGETLADLNADRINADLPQAAIDAGATPTIGNRGIQDVFINPDASGYGTYDLLGKTLVLEAGGFVSQQQLQPGAAVGTAGGGAGQNFNQAITGGVFFGPSFTNRFADDQNVALSYRTSVIGVLDQNTDAQIGNDGEVTPFRFDQFLSNSMSHEIEAAYGTGYLFEPLMVEVTTMARFIDEQGSDIRPDQHVEQYSIGATGIVAMTSRFSFLGTLGYDTIDSSFDAFESDVAPIGPAFSDQSLDQIYYALGFRWLPNRDSFVTASVGERFGGIQVDADVNLRLTSRLNLTANARKQFNTGLQNQQNNNRFFNVAALNMLERFNNSGDSLEDTRIEQISPGILDDLAISSGGGAFIAQPLTTLQASLNGRYGRNNFTVSANATLFDDNNGVEVIGFGGDTIGATITGSRRITRRWTGTLSYRANHIELREGGFSLLGSAEANAITDQFAAASLRFTISRRWSAAVSASHLRRDLENDVTVASLIRGTVFEFEENQARFGVRYQF